MKNIDFTRIKSIQIFEYCDNRSNESYHFKLIIELLSVRKKLVARRVDIPAQTEHLIPV